jgi:processive 1,2-diacylglycerol beta-glucosyltransferase
MKILLLHALTGAGHRRAAEAIAKAFQNAVPSAEVKVCDILEFTPPLFRKTYAEGYLDLVRKAPELWGYLYSESDRKANAPWRKEIRALFNKLNAVSFFKFYRDFDPDLAVCTHFTPLQLLSSKRGRDKKSAPLYGVITDFAVHGLWILENVDCYYVATDEARRHLVRRGQPEDRVSLTGIPIDPVFERSQRKEDALRSLGLDSDFPVVLLLGGGFGIGPTLELIRSFGQEPPICRLLVVTGANEKLRKQAELLADAIRTPVNVYGFVSNIHVMMDASDLVISKPGGLTTSEVLAKGKPMLVIDPIPGQEQRNCEAVLEAGAAARLFEVEDAYYKVASLLNDRSRLMQMGSNARKMGRPHAAAAIVADILRRSGKDMPSNRPR